MDPIPCLSLLQGESVTVFGPQGYKGTKGDPVSLTFQALPSLLWDQHWEAALGSSWILPGEMEELESTNSRFSFQGEQGLPGFDGDKGEKGEDGPVGEKVGISQSLWGRD